MNSKIGILLFLVWYLASCEAEEEEGKSKFYRFVENLNKVHEKARNVDSSMKDFAKGVNEAAEWMEDFRHEPGSRHKADSTSSQ